MHYWCHIVQAGDLGIQVDSTYNTAERAPNVASLFEESQLSN